MPQTKREIAVAISLKNSNNKKKLDQLLIDATNKNNRNKRPEDRRDKIIPIDAEIRKFGITILDNDRSRESVKKKIQQLQSAKKIKQSKTELPNLFS